MNCKVYLYKSPKICVQTGSKLFIFLSFSGNVFCSPEVPPTLEQIDHSFGATHPGGKKILSVYIYKYILTNDLESI